MTERPKMTRKVFAISEGHNQENFHGKKTTTMQPKVLRYIFVSVFVLVALTMLLPARTSNDALTSSKVPLVLPQPAFITFDVPGTLQNVNGINPAGAITGWYSDTSGVFHGFLRTLDGTITTFDPPGSIGTLPSAITATGVIIGSYFDAGGVTRGFLRMRGGSFATIDVPGPHPRPSLASPRAG